VAAVEVDVAAAAEARLKPRRAHRRSNAPAWVQRIVGGNFAPPNLNIDSTGTGTATGVSGANVAFGRITQAGAARRFVVNARLNF
jgi:hypothetical protein